MVIVEMIVVVILVAIVVGGAGRVSMVYVGMNRVLLLWRLLM